MVSSWITGAVHFKSLWPQLTWELLTLQSRWLWELLLSWIALLWAGLLFPLLLPALLLMEVKFPKVNSKDQWAVTSAALSINLNILFTDWIFFPLSVEKELPSPVELALIMYLLSDLQSQLIASPSSMSQLDLFPPHCAANVEQRILSVEISVPVNAPLTLTNILTRTEELLAEPAQLISDWF